MFIIVLIFSLLWIESCFSILLILDKLPSILSIFEFINSSFFELPSFILISPFSIYLISELLLLLKLFKLLLAFKFSFSNFKIFINTLFPKKIKAKSINTKKIITNKSTQKIGFFEIFWLLKACFIQTNEPILREDIWGISSFWPPFWLEIKSDFISQVHEALIFFKSLSIIFFKIQLSSHNDLETKYSSLLSFNVISVSKSEVNKTQMSL